MNIYPIYSCIQSIGVVQPKYLSNVQLSVISEFIIGLTLSPSCQSQIQ